MRPHRTISRLLARPLARALAFGVSAFAGAAQAQTPYILIDDALEVRRVEVVRFDVGSLVFTGAGGEQLTRPTDELHVLAALDAADVALPSELLDAPTPPLVLETTGGQRLLVRVEPSSSDDELIVVADRLGRVALPLEMVTRLARLGEPARPTPGTQDTIHLVNGDRLDGFIVSLGDEVVIELEAADGSIALDRVPIDRVASVSLANPETDRPEALVTLRGGAIVGAESLRSLGAGSVELTLAQGAFRPLDEPTRTMLVAFSDVRGVRYTHPRARAVPLSSLDAPDVTPMPERRWSPPPRVLPEPSTTPGLRPVDLLGPVSVRYELPRGASRFGAVARLAPGPYADCELVVSIERFDGTTAELARRRLRSGMGETAISLALPQQSEALRIRVDPGDDGPIQDRVVLHHPMLIIDAGEEN